MEPPAPAAQPGGDEEALVTRPALNAPAKGVVLARRNMTQRQAPINDAATSGSSPSNTGSPTRREPTGPATQQEVYNAARQRIFDQEHALTSDSVEGGTTSDVAQQRPKALPRHAVADDEVHEYARSRARGGGGKAYLPPPFDHEAHGFYDFNNYAHHNPNHPPQFHQQQQQRPPPPSGYAHQQHYYHHQHHNHHHQQQHQPTRGQQHAQQFIPPQHYHQHHYQQQHYHQHHQQQHYQQQHYHQHQHWPYPPEEFDPYASYDPLYQGPPPQRGRGRGSHGVPDAGQWGDATNGYPIRQARATGRRGRGDGNYASLQGGPIYEPPGAYPYPVGDWWGHGGGSAVGEGGHPGGSGSSSQRMSRQTSPQGIPPGPGFGAHMVPPYSAGGISPPPPPEFLERQFWTGPPPPAHQLFPELHAQSVYQRRLSQQQQQQRPLQEGPQQQQQQYQHQHHTEAPPDHGTEYDASAGHPRANSDPNAEAVFPASATNGYVSVRVGVKPPLVPMGYPSNTEAVSANQPPYSAPRTPSDTQTVPTQSTQPPPPPTQPPPQSTQPPPQSTQPRPQNTTTAVTSPSPLSLAMSRHRPSTT